MIRTAILALSCVFFFGGVASASTYWSAPANSFVPTSASIQGNRYITVGATIKHQASSTAQITAFAAVPPNNGGTLPNTLEMAYSDPDGFGNNYRVRTIFIRKAIFSNTLTNIATLDSNDFSDSGSHVVKSVGFSHTLDFGSNVYYVRADIFRNNTSAEAILFHARLDWTFR